MARELRWWLVAVIIACGAIGLAYLPPRGGVKAPWRAAFMDPFGNGSPARRRAQALAAQWREADMQLGLMQVRDEVQSELARRAAAGVAGPALLIKGPDPIPETARRWQAAALDTVWHDLGLSVTKVSVGMVLEWIAVGSGTGQTPGRATVATARLLPNAADPTSCVVLMRLDARSAPRTWGRVDGPQGPTRIKDEMKEWLSGLLGPCAFYAAFGVPGTPVRHWLSRRGYDLALYPDWDEGTGASKWSWLRDPNTQQWRRSSLYMAFPLSMSATALGCLGGQLARCRDAVLEGAESSARDADSQFVFTQNSWLGRKLRLLDGERYLSDVAHDVGPERFLEFWTSEDPVDTALAVALKAPVGEWTKRWQRRFEPVLPLGAAAPPSASALAILVAAVAVAGVAVAATRRQVR